ncbi:MAG: hypothetical protein FWG05_02325 [Kiritimatiellaeota bacterium]|nr:hypothetical protein [Kiritimatiellota bacterium]
MRLKKILIYGLPVLFAFMGIRFALWRNADKTAWPERDANVSFNFETDDSDSLNPSYIASPLTNETQTTQARLAEYFECQKFTGGLNARYVALGNTMLMTRALIISPIVFETPDEVAETLSALRLAEEKFTVWLLADSLRCDKKVIDQSITDIYADLHLHKKAALIVRWLGGNEPDTRANIDALFSRLISNAALPYSPDGITAGLPKWCAGKGRIPWTRDHIGASVAQSYLRHASFAAAVDPSVILELRAARIAVALEFFKSQHGAYPETFDELISSGLLIPADIIDPFAPATFNLSYARDIDGWRFWSVGLNQKDGGGLLNAFHADKKTDLRNTDLVFTSREREIQMAR